MFVPVLLLGRVAARCPVGGRGLPHLRADFEHLRGADRDGGQHADLAFGRNIRERPVHSEGRNYFEMEKTRNYLSVNLLVMRLY